jgi:hypothetical protein
MLEKNESWNDKCCETEGAGDVNGPVYHRSLMTNLTGEGKGEVKREV